MPRQREYAKGRTPAPTSAPAADRQTPPVHGSARRSGHPAIWTTRFAGRQTPPARARASHSVPRRPWLDVASRAARSGPRRRASPPVGTDPDSESRTFAGPRLRTRGPWSTSGLTHARTPRTMATRCPHSDRPYGAVKPSDRGESRRLSLGPSQVRDSEREAHSLRAASLTQERPARWRPAARTATDRTAPSSPPTAASRAA